MEVVIGLSACEKRKGSTAHHAHLLQEQGMKDMCLHARGHAMGQACVLERDLLKTRIYEQTMYIMGLLALRGCLPCSAPAAE